MSEVDTHARVLVEDRGDGVRLITMNRPDALNAMDADQYEQITAALTTAAIDDDVVVVVITGAGRAFSSGADTRVLAGDTDEPERIMRAFPDFCERLVDFPKPLIAAVNGVGVGIGMTMLLHCDMVVMADDARLRTPFTRIGVSPEAGSSVLLPAVVGPQHAAHMLMVGDWVDANEAVDMGLALRAVPTERLLDDALGLASEVTAGDPHSLQATKKLLVEGRTRLLGDTIHREIEVLSELVVRRLDAEAN